jgi:hypothetical protein
VRIAGSAGGITVLLGARLFAANRANFGKFLVNVGTGHGLFTIAIRILTEIWTGQIWELTIISLG